MTATILSPFVWRKYPGTRYPYRLIQPLQVRLDAPWLPIHPTITFLSQGKTIATLKDNVLTIHSGYAIDGASGAPLDEHILLEVFLHDLFYQFGQCTGAPWTRRQADQLFLQLMRLHNFPLARTYYHAVRFFGWLHYRSHSNTWLKYTPKYQAGENRR
jgi:hypothetical protein